MDCKSYNNCCFYQDYRSCTTEDITGDWFGEVDLADLKQEPDDVCCVLCLSCISLLQEEEFVQIVGNRKLY